MDPRSRKDRARPRYPRGKSGLFSGSGSVPSCPINEKKRKQIRGHNFEGHPQFTVSNLPISKRSPAEGIRLATSCTLNNASVYTLATAAKACWLSEFKGLTNHGSSKAVWKSIHWNGLQDLSNNNIIKNIYIYSTQLYTLINNYQNVSRNMSCLCVYACMHVCISGLNLAAAQKSSTAVWSSSWNDTVLHPLNELPLFKQHIFWCCRSHTFLHAQTWEICILCIFWSQLSYGKTGWLIIRDSHIGGLTS